MAEKPHFNLIFIGHVDHGKSTTIGSLMYRTGNIDDQVMRKLKEKAEMYGKSGFEFAYVMDNLKEEQEKGITINLSHKKFETDKSKYVFTIIDAPGHADFIRNMITGVSQADAAVLVVAATDGVNAQTKEHIQLAKIFGIEQIIVAVNKMDAVGYKEARFNEVVEDVKKVTNGLRFRSIEFMPISSLQGDNIVEKSSNLDWYPGVPLVDKLNDFEPAELPIDLPLRLPLQGVYNIKGVGLIPVGRIETGILRSGDKIVAVPSKTGTGMLGEAKEIEMHYSKMSEAKAGDNVGLNVKGFQKGDLQKGDVLGHTTNPPSLVSEFTANVMIMNHPNVVTVGYSPVFHVHTSLVSCKIEELIEKVVPTKEANPPFLKNGEMAKIRVKPLKPLVIEKQSEIPQLSSFPIRDMNKTVAAGKCIDIVKKELKF